MFSADNTTILGYGGYALVTPFNSSAYQVLLTSGSFSAEHTPSYSDMLDNPAPNPPTDGGDPMTRVLHADGVSAYTGSIAFDVDSKSVEIFGKCLFRRVPFDVSMADGANAFQMTSCFLTSLSMSASAGGLMTSSISFMGATGKTPASVSASYRNFSSYPDFGTNPTPLAYWRTGNTDVREWSLSMSQAVKPMYGNIDSTDIYSDGSVFSSNPKYLKVGAVEYSLEVTTYTPQVYGAIHVLAKSFAITGRVTSVGYQFGGLNDFGMYTHKFESMSNTGSSAVDVIAVTGS